MTRLGTTELARIRAKLRLLVVALALGGLAAGACWAGGASPPVSGPSPGTPISDMPYDIRTPLPTSAITIADRLRAIVGSRTPTPTPTRVVPVPRPRRDPLPARPWAPPYVPPQCSIHPRVDGSPDVFCH
jgi:hypothetical protein